MAAPLAVLAIPAPIPHPLEAPSGDRQGSQHQPRLGSLSALKAARARRRSSLFGDGLDAPAVYEDALGIGLQIGGDEKEARIPRLVIGGKANYLTAVLESKANLLSELRRSPRARCEHEEDRFEAVHRNVLGATCGLDRDDGGRQVQVSHRSPLHLTVQEVNDNAALALEHGGARHLDRVLKLRVGLGK